MKEDINILISKTVGEIIPTYAVLADIDNGVKCPYAFYRIKQSGVRTKECVRSIYDTGVFLVGDTFDQVNELCEKVKAEFMVYADVTMRFLSFRPLQIMMQMTGNMCAK